MGTFWTTLRQFAHHSLEAYVANSAFSPLPQADSVRRLMEPADITVVSEGYGVERAALLCGYAQVAGQDVTSLSEFGSRVLAAAPKRSIRSLYLAGHGRPGSQIIAGYPGPAPRLELTPDNVDELAVLRSRMTNDAVVTLGGCNVGQGDRGAALLGRLAVVLGAVTQGSSERQYSSHGLEGSSIRVCRSDPSLSAGYECRLQAEAVDVPGDRAGGLSWGSPLRVVSDAGALFHHWWGDAPLPFSSR